MGKEQFTGHLLLSISLSIRVRMVATWGSVMSVIQNFGDRRCCWCSGLERRIVGQTFGRYMCSRQEALAKPWSAVIERVSVDRLLRLSLGSNKIFASLPCTFDSGRRWILSISPASAGNYLPARLSGGISSEMGTANLSPNIQLVSVDYTLFEDIAMVWGQ